MNASWMGMLKCCGGSSCSVGRLSPDRLSLFALLIGDELDQGEEHAARIEL